MAKAKNVMVRAIVNIKHDKTPYQIGEEFEIRPKDKYLIDKGYVEIGDSNVKESDEEESEDSGETQEEGE